MSKPSTHVRIGKVEEYVRRLVSDANEARQFREYYVAQGDMEKARYWEGKFEYAQTTSSNMARDFKLEIKEFAL